MVTAEFILSATYKDIFEPSETSIKSTYRALLKLYHPDISSTPKEVTIKLTELYNSALKSLRSGAWGSKATFTYVHKGQTFTIGFNSHRVFELGSVYDTDDSTFFILDSAHEKYYLNYIYRTSHFKFPSEELKVKLTYALPIVKNHFKLDDTRFLIEISKQADIFNLSDILNFKRSLNPKDVAWIVSRLYSIVMLLDYNGISHNGIDLNSLYVCPKHHTVQLFGGWWYAVDCDSKLIGTTSDIYSRMHVKYKGEKLGTIYTDLESIRMVATKLLGENITTLPKAYADWLNKGTAFNALDEYSNWDNSLISSYGEKKFHIFSVNKDDIYK